MRDIIEICREFRRVDIIAGIIVSVVGAVVVYGGVWVLWFVLGLMIELGGV